MRWLLFHRKARQAVRGVAVIPKFLSSLVGAGKLHAVFLLESRTRARWMEQRTGIRVLRRAYEHVLVMAVLEGTRTPRRPYYEDYVDALRLLGAKSELIARQR
jgi:hypothetical protein